VIFRYDEIGHTIGTPEFEPPTPTRLQWDLPVACVETIEACFLGAQALLQDVDLRIYVHDNYGKGFMKKCRVSPDAFIQMALQLAYYRVS
jgi:carnitine O-palmitoyltransferase 1